MTIRSGVARCGAMRRMRARSLAASRTRAMSPCCRERTPPWISLELRLEVPAAKSTASSSATERPRRAASRAIPAPVMPPPTTSRSRSASGRAARAVARAAGVNAAMARPGRLLLRAELVEGRLRLGDLVGAAFFLRDLQRAGGEADCLVAVTALPAGLGERDARRHGVVVALHHLAQQPLAFHRIAAEQLRQPHEQGALGRHGVDVVRVELERAIDLAEQPTQRKDGGDLLAVQAQQLAEVAHHAEVRLGAVLVERDGLRGECFAALEVLLPGL